MFLKANRESVSTLTGLIDTSEKALYLLKKDGRNCVRE